MTSLKTALENHFGDQIKQITTDCDEVLIIEVSPHHLKNVALKLRDHEEFQFNVLIDICGIDYLTFGRSEWETAEATLTGFERGVLNQQPLQVLTWKKPRFAAAYQLLSTKFNRRLRLKVFVDEQNLIIPSIADVWPSANWAEREAFDLYGILFDGHPDLRRILTDYGFIGHPFRKDFPISGQIQVRYDAKLGRVVYEPVDIEPRVLVPKVIRLDNRYEERNTNAGETSNG